MSRAEQNRSQIVRIHIGTAHTAEMIRHSLELLAASQNLLQCRLIRSRAAGYDGDTLASVQASARKYKALALSGQYDSKTSELLMELTEMVEVKAKEFDSAPKS